MGDARTQGTLMAGVLMTAAAHHLPAQGATSARRTLVVLEAAIALCAVGGGIYGLAGAQGRAERVARRLTVS